MVLQEPMNMELKLLGKKTIIDRFGIHDNPEEIERVMGGH